MERVWETPCPGAEHPQGLKLYNSLVDEKVPFVPRSGPGSRTISWYNCGPTVYDSAHMGHARNYLTVDIIRRVLEDYFGYNVLFIMNVTDVDDKIIKRARRNHLLSEYRANATDSASAAAFASDAAEDYRVRAERSLEDAKKALANAEAAASSGDKAASRVIGDLATAVQQEELKVSQARATIQALEGLTSPSVDAILDVAKDAIAESLDRAKGANVTDPGIYRAHAARYEKEFLEDMERLGVRPADVMPRVSEYMPEIVEYVQKIIAQGLAYESAGSVYFDTTSFREKGHVYGKLNPWAVGSALAAEGEVGGDFAAGGKRSLQDFALWKASKPGEPAWESPWGMGRPGWHIECSAMASAIVGQHMDIHSGGHDLRFPHHTNELAQAEAYYHDCGCHQWVDYFLHTGHLNIEGLKMSKSLKNFITIREALEKFSARQLRLMFLLQPWDKSMMYGEQAQGEMKAKEALLKNFFGNVEVALRESKAEAPTRWEGEERDLMAAIQASERQVHAALCNSVDTRSAMDSLSELIRNCNVYLAARGTSAAAGGPGPQTLLLRKAAAFVMRICSVFGLVSGPSDRLAFSEGAASGQSDSLTAALMDAFSSFRDDVREAARSNAPAATTLAMCDRVRDETLVELGVRLEDRASGKAVWKMEDPATLKAEAEERKRAAQEAKAKKIQSAIESRERDLAKLQKIAEMPSVQDALRDKYSKFDDAGNPTHDAEGSELDDKGLKKAKKDVEKERKMRAPLTKAIERDGADVLKKLAAEVKALQQELGELEAV